MRLHFPSLSICLLAYFASERRACDGNFPEPVLFCSIFYGLFAMLDLLPDPNIPNIAELGHEASISIDSECIYGFASQGQLIDFTIAGEHPLILELVLNLIWK